MVSDNSYVECLVSSKASPLFVVLKVVSLILAILSFLSSLLLGSLVGMILAIALVQLTISFHLMPALSLSISTATKRSQ